MKMDNLHSVLSLRPSVNTLCSFTGALQSQASNFKTDTTFSGDVAYRDQ